MLTAARALAPSLLLRLVMIMGWLDRFGGVVGELALMPASCDADCLGSLPV